MTTATKSKSIRRLQPPLVSAELTGLAGKAGEIAAVIEERLILGVYKFGDPLSIYALSEEFGSSRQPVAAAINHLRSSGYIEVIP